MRFLGAFLLKLVSHFLRYYLFCRVSKILALHTQKRPGFIVRSAHLPYYHSSMQISPPLPSLMMRCSVSCILIRASSGMCDSFPESPSLTSSCSDLPKMSVSHIFAGSFSNSSSRYLTSSSDCFSVDMHTAGKIYSIEYSL